MSIYKNFVHMYRFHLGGTNRVEGGRLGDYAFMVTSLLGNVLFLSFKRLGG